MPTPDAVVVGGGLVGSALAYELVTAGADTVLIDRADPGRATDAGAGILSPETHQDPDPDRFVIGMASALHYPDLVDRLAEDGLEGSGFAVTGSLLVAERPGDDHVIERAAQLVAARSPGWWSRSRRTRRPATSRHWDRSAGPSTARPVDGSTAERSARPCGRPPSPAGSRSWRPR